MKKTVAVIAADAVRTQLEGALREENLGSLTEREIPRPVPEAIISVSSETQALQRRRGGAPLFRPSYVAVPAADAGSEGDERARYQPYPGAAF